MYCTTATTVVVYKKNAGGPFREKDKVIYALYMGIRTAEARSTTWDPGPTNSQPSTPPYCRHSLFLKGKLDLSDVRGR